MNSQDRSATNQTSQAASGQPQRRKIYVEALARVEGEGAFHLITRDGQVEDVQLNLFDPPRYFEAFLRGRSYLEVPDIVARICGICPVAYQMSACHALEKACGVFDQIDPSIRRLRDLFYCGEWIESHTLHMFMLHLPDFLGYESVLSMVSDYPELVQGSLRVKKAGNAILEMQGGRSVHPVGARVGGFYRPPSESEVAELLPELVACRDEMSQIVLQLAEIVEFPDFERDYEFVSLCPDDHYPMNLGRIKSNQGLDIEQEEFLEAIEEFQVAHSNALHATIRDRGAYLVGPLARLNLNADKLHPRAAELVPQVCDRTGRNLPWKNMYFSLLARGLEVVHAFALAVDILDGYSPLTASFLDFSPRAGEGSHGTEAPRGLCWHTYQTEEDGSIRGARIIPPTSQNQTIIQEDLRAIAPQLASVDESAAQLRCERIIRNYDPCISCSVH